MSKASNNENKETKKLLVVEGVVTSARVGSSKFDETIKNRLSIKCEEGVINYDDIKPFYENVGSKMTPKWIKEESGYVNVSSKFDIPVKDTFGRQITFEEFTESATAIGSKVKLALTVKEGCVYPTAFVVLEEGEEVDPFKNL